jgi:hypothetical protein
MCRVDILGTHIVSAWYSLETRVRHSPTQAHIGSTPWMMPVPPYDLPVPPSHAASNLSHHYLCPPSYKCHLACFSSIPLLDLKHSVWNRSSPSGLRWDKLGKQSRRKWLGAEPRDPAIARGSRVIIQGWWCDLRRRDMFSLKEFKFTFGSFRS